MNQTLIENDLLIYKYNDLLRTQFDSYTFEEYRNNAFQAEQTPGREKYVNTYISQIAIRGRTIKLKKYPYIPSSPIDIYHFEKRKLALARFQSLLFNNESSEQANTDQIRCHVHEYNSKIIALGLVSMLGNPSAIRTNINSPIDNKKILSFTSKEIHHVIDDIYSNKNDHFSNDQLAKLVHHFILDQYFPVKFIEFLNQFEYAISSRIALSTSDYGHFWGLDFYDLSTTTFRTRFIENYYFDYLLKILNAKLIKDHTIRREELLKINDTHFTKKSLDEFEMYIYDTPLEVQLKNLKDDLKSSEESAFSSINLLTQHEVEEKLSRIIHV